ncbi:type II toxin-antitoxin system RelE/ParE family toxin [Mesorhizobium sp. WSM4313]|uniref:type II toxin-antitoxin system RelE family toxin n=1 Tax=Mesorhizobium sp. WSM4313 TaxID=2029412 RepID=UPI000BAEDE62|nr:type II toxin-antitoxin system RelE/ParE family toxin [Mesorhizobium sp. WSM4313]PBB19323.1 type II toxin-antitoxin system mRNA interferase toxin, RelE/StbE family [Mesorhizobium sp. WSM4313]
MDDLEVVFSPAARREIKKLARDTQRLVLETLEELQKTPRPRGVEKIQGHPDFYRIKAGHDHRIIYHILRERLLVVLVIRDRKDAYKGLDDLDGKLGAALQSIDEQMRVNLGLGAR